MSIVENSWNILGRDIKVKNSVSPLVPKCVEAYEACSVHPFIYKTLFFGFANLFWIEHCGDLMSTEKSMLPDLLFGLELFRKIIVNILN